MCFLSSVKYKTSIYMVYLLGDLWANEWSCFLLIKWYPKSDLISFKNRNLPCLLVQWFHQGSHEGQGGSHRGLRGHSWLSGTEWQPTELSHSFLWQILSSGIVCWSRNNLRVKNITQFTQMINFNRRYWSGTITASVTLNAFNFNSYTFFA